MLQKRARGVLLALAFILLAAPSARAAITSTLQLGGLQIAPQGAATNTFYIAGQVQPAASRGTPPTLVGCAPAGSGATGNFAGCTTYFDTDHGFNAIDLGASAGPGQDNGTNSNMLQFQLTSTLAATGATGTLGYEVVVYAYPAAGASGKLFVPIAGVNGTPCSSGGCYTLGATSPVPVYPGGAAIYYAAPFTPGSTVTIGLYPADICYSGATQVAEAGQTPAAIAGCSTSASTVTQGTALGGYQVDPLVLGQQTNPSQIEIEFDIFPIPTGGPNVAIVAQTPASDSSSGYILNFQGDTPTMVPSDNCPNLATSYTPGDGQISLNSNVLSLDELTANAGMASARDLNHAPPYEIVVASTSGPGSTVPNVGNNPMTAQQTAASDLALSSPPDILYGGTISIPGFDNVTSSATASGPGDTTHVYQLQFMLRDSTGMVAVPFLPSSSTGTLCTLANVQTSTIQGFLASSKCFIATGAFRSGTAAPVMLLRAFRDQVLLHSGLGQSFVRWYYGWSPPAALWLIDHPIFRLPVLLALLPVEGLAWLALHPALFLMALAGAAAALFVGACIRLSRAYPNSDKDRGGRAGEA